jgi:hypothetical protein
MTDGTKLTLRHGMPLRKIKSLLEDAKCDQRVNQLALSDIYIFPLIAQMVVAMLECRRWDTIRLYRCSDRVDLVAQAAAKQSNVLILDRCNLNAGLAHGNPSLVESVAQEVHSQSQLTSLHILEYTFESIEMIQGLAQGFGDYFQSKGFEFKWLPVPSTRSVYRFDPGPRCQRLLGDC